MNFIVVGADASSAFAEAPAPVAPLYVVVNQPFRESWKKKGRGDIPKGWVIPVKHALQGHPESPRLWARMIDDIITTDIRLKPYTHEPCLYEGTIKDQKVLFLRQVDDFAISCADVDLANDIIDRIGDKLSAPMKKLGIIYQYNDLDIEQGSDYIKLHRSTYIKKILSNHGWL